MERPTFVNLEETSCVLGVPRSQLRERAKRGEIPAIRVGNGFRFDPEAVRASLNSHQRVSFTVHQAAEYLGIEVAELQKLIDDGEGPAGTTLGKTWISMRQFLDEWAVRRQADVGQLRTLEEGAAIVGVPPEQLEAFAEAVEAGDQAAIEKAIEQMRRHRQKVRKRGAK